MKSSLILDAFVQDNESFVNILKETLRNYNMTTKEFARLSNIPENTLYKILTDNQKDFRSSTLRTVIKTIKKLEGSDEPFIAIISSRGVLDRIATNNLEVNGKNIKLKEFPSTSIEEVMINSVKAEKLGAKGIVCGPIAASSIGNIVSIPISAILLDDQGVEHALKTISGKI